MQQIGRINGRLTGKLQRIHHLRVVGPAYPDGIGLRALWCAT